MGSNLQSALIILGPRQLQKQRTLKSLISESDQTKPKTLQNKVRKKVRKPHASKKALN